MQAGAGLSRQLEGQRPREEPAAAPWGGAGRGRAGEDLGGGLAVWEVLLFSQVSPSWQPSCSVARWVAVRGVDQRAEPEAKQHLRLSHHQALPE